MPRHAQFFAATALTIAFAVASCAPVDPATPKPAQSARPTAQPALPSTQSPPASSDPSPTAVPSDAISTALPEGGTEVFPGRYTARITPALTLTVDREVNIDCAPGYRCRGDVDVNLPNWLDMEFGHDHPIEIHVMAFDQVFGPGASKPLVKPPDDLAGWIAAMPGVRIDASTPITVGGIPAWQLDLQTGDADLVLGPISGAQDISELGFGAHQVHRVDVLHVGGRAVVIGLGPVLAEDSTKERLAAAAAMLQPIVDSITWQ